MQTGTFAKAERRAVRSPGTDLAIALAVGLVVALARRYFGFHIGIPGHAGIGWIAALVGGSTLTRRPGLATVAGVSAGMWGVPLGVGQGALLSMVMLGSAGAVLDVLRTLRFPIHLAPGAALAGAAVHFVKFAVLFGNALLAGMVRHVEAYGFIASLRNHVLFGLLGGLLAWAVGRGFRAARVAAIGRGEAAIGRGHGVGIDGIETLA